MNQRRTSETRRLLRLLIPAAVVLVLVIAWRFAWRGGEKALLVYCAHDSVYAQQIIDDFTKRTGIPVVVRYDTEATKSLGLVELLLREKDRPRCDVFWNNQLLGTLDLAEQGILEPYKGAGYARIPAAFKDVDGRWAGFGARVRVYIVNTDRMKGAPDAKVLGERLATGDLSRAAIAKPLYGTTLTHYAVLWRLWGGDRLKAWDADARKRGLTVATGNAHVKELVASGACDFGLTDSDDFFSAKDEGRPVAMVPVRLTNGAAIAIPNTIAIIHGAMHLDAAKMFVDYVLSREGEVALARSTARQVPLGEVDEGALPPEVRELHRAVADGYPLTGLRAPWHECLAWLKAGYAQ